MYVIGMNLGTYYLDKDSATPIDTFSGGSQIVDYRGQVVTEVPYGAGSTWIAGTIDIEALRNFRQTAQWDNWMKDLTTEQYQLVYEQPIYPKNLYLDRAPYTHAEYREQVTRKQVELLQERGVWARPGRPASVPAPAEAPAEAPAVAPAKVDAQVPIEAKAPAPTVG